MAKITVQHRRGSTSDWIEHGNDIIPLVGEIVAEVNENGVNKLKVGDGVNTYPNLNYIGQSNIVVTSISLLASNWINENDLCFQTVTIPNTTQYSRIDLQPTVSLLQNFYKNNIILTTENKDGVINVYSLGDKPTEDYEIQIAITEVEINE